MPGTARKFKFSGKKSKGGERENESLASIHCPFYSSLERRKHYRARSESRHEGTRQEKRMQSPN